ncbi:hypothetical protein HNQ86_001122 [Oleiagrimonas soli]|uniref:CopL family metal-binding regulatory protein n=1 Tax=Oleiagrimonas soli TaxID=1543381 RepID=A0A841KII7_9GAMM|nr:hypothetical protein [Oleiagrimonas soli]
MSLQRLSHAPRLTALALFAWLLMATLPTLAGARTAHASSMHGAIAQMHAHAGAPCGMPCCGGAGHDGGCLHACGCALTCGGVVVMAQGPWPALPRHATQTWSTQMPDWSGPLAPPPLRPPRV